MSASACNLPPEKWKPPEYFEEYRLRRRVGRGGFGEVFLGHDLLLDRPVAVKFISAAHPDAKMRDRFLSEARAAARLQHPNVVSIYRVGEVQGRLFIVSEYLRGKSLAALPRPMGSGQVLAIGVGLARGLAAAHRAGVLHRDIKPANAALTHDGEPKLLDFGIAKLLSSPDAAALVDEPASFDAASPATAADGGHPSGEWSGESLYAHSDLTGTPLYMAPEVLLGEPASRRSDIYSMGVLLFELCVGRPPFYHHLHARPAELDPTADAQGSTREVEAEMSPHERLRQAVTTTDAPKTLSQSPSLDPVLGAIIDRCLRRNPAERYLGADELREALEGLQQPNKKEVIPEGNPYRGLRPFESQHRPFFFGRQAEIGTVLDRLRTEPWITVAADSGIGKSSLCRAGVIPLIQSGVLDPRRTWQVVTAVPGRRPLQVLADRLAEVLGTESATLATQLRHDPLNLPRTLRKWTGTSRGLLIFIDQLEELITISDATESAAVTEAFGTLMGAADGVRLLSTVRSDFLARVATLPALGDDFLRHVYLLRAMGPDNLREAIVGPARLKGVTFESDLLVKELVESTAHADGALPLLQFALAELWEVRSADRISAQAIASLGGVTGALARHADHVISVLPVNKRASARRILMSLVTLEGTRARRMHDELTRSDPHAASALEALVKGRLLIATDTADGAAYEVAHEALIHGWTTLSRWLSEHQESRAARQRLEQAAAEWTRLKHSRDALWGKQQLAEIAVLEPDDIGKTEAAFLEATRKGLQRRELFMRAAAVLVPLLLVLAYGGYQFKQRRDLRQQVDLRVEQSILLLEKADRLNVQVEEWRKQAFAAFDSQQRDLGEGKWAKLQEGAGEVDELYARASQALEGALALDGTRIDVKRRLAAALYARAVAAERDNPRSLRHRDLLARIKLYDIDAIWEKQWNAPSLIDISSHPAGASVTISRYVENKLKKFDPIESHSAGTTPLTAIELPQGSYLITLQKAGYAEIRYPIRLQRAEIIHININVPREDLIPARYVYIPPGRFLFGSAEDETFRKSFLTAVPIHNAITDGYLIGKYEVTFGEWIEYLSAISTAERAKRAQKRDNGGLNGAVNLKQLPDGHWELMIRPGEAKLVTRNGDNIYYKGRKSRATQDWMKMPVCGINKAEAEAYAEWLSQSRRLPGARLCTEHEWERAARGADERAFPHGNSLTGDEANVDETYAKDPLLVGPDEVGSYPQTVSPFGVYDLSGNAWEWVTSQLDPQESLNRSGGFFYTPTAARLDYRAVVAPTYRDSGSGMRICAPFPG